MSRPLLHHSFFGIGHARAFDALEALGAHVDVAEQHRRYDPWPGCDALQCGRFWDQDTGQTLLEFGYTGDNVLQYRVGGGSLWQTTAVSVGTQGWSQATMTVDAFSNTASFSAIAWDDGNGSLTSHDFITDVDLGINASPLESLQWST